ncbi:MAG: DeoR family transcriptional regulator [bacterium]
MYQPIFSISNKILNSIVEFEKTNQEISSIALSANDENDVISNTKTLNLFHVAHILGVELSLKDAQKAAQGNKISTEDARGTILNNFRNLHEFIRSKNDNFIQVDLNLLLHFNKILLSDWQDNWNVKFRATIEDRDPFLDNWTSLVDNSVEPLRLQNEILSLLDWYRNSVDIYPLIKLSSLVYRLIRLAPYAFLNKLTIISLTEYLFAKIDYENIKFLPFARIFDLSSEQLIQAIYQVRDNSENQTAFIEQFLQNLLFNIQDSRARLKRNLNSQKKNVSKPFLDLNKRQLKILRYLQTIPTVRREDYVQMMDVSPMTSFRDLNGLVEKKLLKVDGKGRSTRYILFNR